MPELLRLLTPQDLPGAMRLKSAAGWNQTEQDWLRFLELQPDGCFGIEVDGTLTATAGAIAYGTALGWIGMVLTLPEFRGRGYAARLMVACIDFLESRGVEWMKLDATEEGRPIYERLGFQFEEAIERWWHPPLAAGKIVLDPFWLDSELDKEAFGADRRALLARLAEGDAVTVSGTGFAMARPGSQAHYFGPCIARTAKSARIMLAWALGEAGSKPMYWDILPDNTEAVRMAGDFGFERMRQLARMSRRGAGQAPAVPAKNALVYAIAGFEYG